MEATQIATQHTSGPWECSKRPVGPFWHISSGHSVRGPCLSGKQAVASVHAANKKYDPEYAAMFAANALLITAAPDLLAALENLVRLADSFSVSGVYFNEGKYNQEAIYAAYDAIGKATNCA